ncbi:helix-turn-helix domain-containing protein [Streptomyces sp. NBC_00378]|uniref:helix-turn-helix transcriptional regulator n=1 Tax=unclassified Streptomyces TaxID=2593676 RepID=UPI00224FE8BC|nr:MULTISPECIES: helix-turn-helix domain-containing protein [unclassified Streptomyces]MCX5112170.1 helix-turn-helix domain-containing protein [Streptomyces sp. NBC_00378]MCX5114635.1 helix-turn-helix domain-containing protein [Streptomyces sp. NBC_00378]
MDWVRLGEAFKAARATHEPRLTQDDVQRALDVSRATVQNIERGKAFGRVTPTHRAYARLVGWTDDSVEQVLAGGEPTRTADSESATSEPGAPVPDGLPLRVAEELASGPLLDTMVIRLPGGGQAVVVARGKEGGSPEEIQAALEAWRRAQPQLHEIEVRVDTDEPPESVA